MFMKVLYKKDTKLKRNILRERINGSIEIDVPVTNGNVQSAIKDANSNSSMKTMINNPSTNVIYKLTKPNSSKPDTAVTYSRTIADAQSSIDAGYETAMSQKDTINCSRIITKKMIKEMRRRKLMDESVPFTKKELNSIFRKK